MLNSTRCRTGKLTSAAAAWSDVVTLSDASNQECHSVLHGLQPPLPLYMVDQNWNCILTFSRQNNCVPMCTNKACFARFQYDTGSIAEAYFRLLLNILSIKYSMHGVPLDAKLKHWYGIEGSKLVLRFMTGR